MLTLCVNVRCDMGMGMSLRCMENPFKRRYGCIDVSLISSIVQTCSMIGHVYLTKGECYIHSQGHVDLASGEWVRPSLSPIIHVDLTRSEKAQDSLALLAPG